MMLPLLVQHGKCHELLKEICLIVGKDLSTLVYHSFLTVYIHLHLHEKPEVIAKCLEFMVEQTGSSVQNLLKYDQRVSDGH